MTHVIKAALGLALVLGGLVLGAAAAFGQSPSGGTIKVWVTPSPTGSGGTIVITGAIGDYGKAVSVNSAGKAKKRGQYKLLELKKGTILVNGTQLNAAANNASPTDFNAATCSGSVIASAPVPIVRGTKAYAGITGSVTITETFAFVGPFYKSGSKKGQCNTSSNAPQPPGFWDSVSGIGTVSFG